MKTQDLTEFGSGIEYDAQYEQHYHYDIAFITRLIEETNARSVLDVCCGSGIVTIPVSEQLNEAVGIDISEGMLKHAKDKAKSRSNLRFLHLDATQFSLGKKFDLAIMTGNAFQAFLSDEMLAGALSSISKHLEKGGRLVFDTRLPTPENLELDNEMALWQTYVSPTYGEVNYLGMKAEYDLQTSIMYLKKERHFEGGAIEYSSIDLKYRLLEDIEVFLEQAGFRIIEKYQSWSAQAFEANAKSLVCVAEKI
ncbi:class I SAM-dependent methyltransferase [Vibrio parahaemolyticus]|uniref:class I SAM-dependent methyltransferase n=1 Tax=Vibrio parahaemolyticus TaxID=670 RepID=UPI00084A7B83|nr:class I SAM-dependent methyltransferase [Vibrio parahaemolyticus]EHU5191264.1 class I SAM-dependent methyltransferase [Vibrio parahaemolyticus]ELA8135834.1 class I SAM-dependent methyltransferase [Vibrio parahaemolyticus]ODY55106.1 methyltransferase [Vibrio parahaemolyticus]ODY59065.1 methyltransferase [Vibrio parahaemolyticus]ODY65514.1 methyltransferase [Vibrio parahaemolyticus]